MYAVWLLGPEVEHLSSHGQHTRTWLGCGDDGTLSLPAKSGTNAAETSVACSWAVLKSRDVVRC